MRRLSCAGVHLAWAYNWPEAGNFDLPGLQTVTQAPFQPEPAAPPTPSEPPDAIDPSMCQDFARLRSQVARSPLRTYMQNFGTWLRESPYQTAIALGALACGCVCVWDGPRLWENLVIVGFSLAVVWLAHFETYRNELAPNLQSGLALMLAAGVIAGLAVHSGFEGTQVVIGAAAGFAAAAYCGVGAGAEAIDKSLPGISLSWCCAGSSFGAWVLVTWRRPLLACLAPLLGSFLVVSGLGKPDLLLRHRCLAPAGSSLVGGGFYPAWALGHAGAHVALPLRASGSIRSELRSQSLGRHSDDRLRCAGGIGSFDRGHRVQGYTIRSRGEGLPRASGDRWALAMAVVWLYGMGSTGSLHRLETVGCASGLPLSKAQQEDIALPKQLCRS